MSKTCTDAERKYLDALLEGTWQDAKKHRRDVLAERFSPGLRDELLGAWVAKMEAEARLDSLLGKVGAEGDDYMDLIGPVREEARRRFEERKARP